MLFEIGGKYYVKMRNYYKRLDIQGDNIVPSKDENDVIRDMSVLATPISYEEILENNSQKQEKVLYKKRKEK